MVWTGLIWRWIQAGAGIFWTRRRTSAFRKIRGISWPAEKPLAFKQELCSMQLVS
jgi:hypothetical protein